MTRVVQGLSGLILAGILVHSYLLAVMLLQLYLAGPNDVAAESWEWHAIWGYTLGVPILLLMALTLIGRLGWRVVGFAALLAAMFGAQLALNWIPVDAPYLPALYAANGLAMVGLAAAIDRSRNLDDDTHRQAAGPGPNGDHHRQLGGRVATGAYSCHPRSKRVTINEEKREMISTPSSPPALAVDLAGGPVQARISPRGGRQMKGVRIDKGVNDERVRI